MQETEIIYGFGKRSSLRSKPIRSTQQPTTHSTESQLRIQLKARNKSVRQQARLTKSQNTSLGLQSRPFGGCELLQNVYLCSSKHNGFRILESVEERSSSVHRQEIKQRLIICRKCPALYICSDRTRMNISAVRQTSFV